MTAAIEQPKRLRFDHEAHAYELDGRKVLGVTDVIREAGLMGDTSWYTEEGRIRGSYIAEATALDDVNDLDFDGLDDQLKPYVEQWRRFKKESNFVPFDDGIEQKVFDEVYGYAGMLDRRGTMQKKTATIDIKLGAKQNWHGIQLAAYDRTFKVRGKRINVYLSEDNYRVVERTDRNDEAVFLAALAVVKWKANNGVE